MPDFRQNNSGSLTPLGVSTRAATATAAGAAVLHSGRLALGHLAALCLGGVLLAVNRTLLYPVLDKVAADLRLSAAQAGSVASVYFLCLLVSQVVLSFYGDRLGLKRFLVAGYLLAGFAVLGLGLWTTSYATLLFFVGLEGLTMGVFWPVGYSLAVAGVPEGKRGQATAIVGAGLAAGHSLGPVISGLLFGITGGWRLSFALMALPTVLLAIGFIFLVRESPRAASRAGRSLWLPILRDRNLLAIFLASFCALYGFWIVSVWGPVFLQTERGLSLTNSGLYTALVTAVAALAGLVIGPLSDRVGRRRLSWILFLLSAAALGSIAVVRPLWALIAALILYGLGSKFAWDPVQIAWLADLVAEDRSKALGQVVALSSIVGMTSSVIGPVINGWIRDQTGSLQAAFFVGAALALIGAVICSRVRESARPAAL